MVTPSRSQPCPPAVLAAHRQRVDKENQQDDRVLRESNGGLPDSPEPVSISTAARKAALMLAEQQQYSLRHSITSLPHNSCDGLRLAGTWPHLVAKEATGSGARCAPPRLTWSLFEHLKEDTGSGAWCAPPGLTWPLFQYLKEDTSPGTRCASPRLAWIRCRLPPQQAAVKHVCLPLCSACFPWSPAAALMQAMVTSNPSVHCLTARSAHMQTWCQEASLLLYLK